MESANNDVTKLGTQEEIHYQKVIKKKNHKFPKSEQQGSFSESKGGHVKIAAKGPKKKKLVCYCCGVDGHSKPDCKFKTYSCSNCSKIGHLKKVCKNKTEHVNNVDLVDLNLSNLYNLDSDGSNSVKPFYVKLDISNKVIEFLVDTGSALSVISKKDLESFKLGEIEDLKKTTTGLKAYNGSIIIPIGILECRVKYKNLNKVLNLYVVRDGGPPIVGRDWLKEMKILSKCIDFNSLTLQSVIHKYSSVFRTDLGCYKHKTFDLILKENSRPIFCKPRVLPFSLKDRVSKELDRLIAADLLVPVETSDWGTPIVPVVKADGAIRLCGDYKVTLNKFLEVDRYPIPRINDLMNLFRGATLFCTLDLCQAYQQLLLSKESQKLTTITTHKGLYMFKRLPYGIASAPGLLQREMDKLLNGIPGTGCFYDDIVVSGKDKNELDDRLSLVLEKLNVAGLSVKKEKCNFFKDSVTFLGYRIDKEGLHIPRERVRAITEAPPPCNVQEVKAFLGLVNYYSKFVENMSSKAGALYYLLKSNSKFIWGKAQEVAFNRIKESILSNKVLIHYNTELELVVACDASPVGLGAVLSHRFSDGTEKPIAFASRTLTECEKRYAQIDKEALALVFAVKYFHQYVYGRKFILKTDHKPLISIFGEKKGIPNMAAHRLQRYAVFLSGYSYKIEFIKGIDNGNADALSRLPVSGTDSINDVECDKFYINLITTNVKTIVDLDICMEVKKDKILREVFLRVWSGNWPDKIKNVEDQLIPYFNRRKELTVEQGCLLWGHRLVIPNKFRQELLNELHHTHMGIVKMKSLARSYIWWPGIDNDIENMTKSCTSCLANSNNPPKSVLHSWPWPEGPSKRVHLDFLGPVDGRMFVILIDAYSKWVFVRYMPNITTAMTIKILKEYFSLWGIPEKLVTDNGSSLCSTEMSEFLSKNGVFHIRTPPYNPSSNGAAENTVKTFKQFLKKCAKNTDMDTNICNFVLSYNSTKHCATGVSPAELHLGRPLNTSLDRLVPFAKHKYNKSLENAKKNYRGGRVKSYEVGDTIMCKNYSPGDKWIPGNVWKKLSPVTYLIKTLDNNVVKRHLNQIIDRQCKNPSGQIEQTVLLNQLPYSEEDDKAEKSIEERTIGSEEVLHEQDENDDNIVCENLVRKSGRVIKAPNRLNL